MTSQDSLAAVEKEFPAFVAEVRGRLENGARTYGDESLERSPLELVGEMKQEVADIAGWGFILWKRLCAIEAELRKVPE